MRNVLLALERNRPTSAARIVASDDESGLTQSQLVARVLAQAAMLSNAPPVVGIVGENGTDWMVGLLGAALAGKTIVPIPTFFAAEQIGHILIDSQVGLLLSTRAASSAVEKFGCPMQVITQESGHIARPDSTTGGELIIYTSGSTGRPKGVRLGADQLDWQAATLADVTGATKDDLYLSILPLPLLLETICAILVPTLVGGATHFATKLTNSFATGAMAGIADAFETHRPTSTVLVPQVLGAWVGELRASSRSAPASLRFVAVGGAPVPEPLSAASWKLGIPVHEGYGLSECCSVVAVNTPGARKAGTVGRPLPGLNVNIEDGEIVVDGPSVMSNYLGGCPVFSHWRTGDLGLIDAEGYLSIHGRKDNLIVTALGRNISPEWIETMILGDPRVGLCCVIGHGEAHLTAVLAPSRTGSNWFVKASSDDILAMISAACSAAPAYAIPKAFIVADMTDLKYLELLTPNGRFRRSELAAKSPILSQRQREFPSETKETTA